MQLKSIVVKNTKSFRARQETNFDENFNILIGPNGGGKSNLLDIISISMNRYIAPYYLETNTSAGTRIQDATNHNQISLGSLEPHFERPDDDSYVKLTFKLSGSDIGDIEATRDHLKQLRHVERSLYVNSRNMSGFNIENFTRDRIPDSKQISFEIKGGNLQNQSDEGLQDVQRYLKQLNYIDILSDNVDSFSISPPFIHFPAYRGGIHGEYRIETPNESQGDLMSRYMSSTSGEQASAMKFSLYNLASKFLDYKDRSIDGGFQNDEAVTTIQSYLDDIGYNFHFEWVNPRNNAFEMTIEKDGTEYTSRELSSGENEVINILLGILSYRAQGQLVIIDEPELHLHATWQRLMVDLLERLNEKSRSQFLIATHSGAFINRDRIPYVKRVAQISNTSKISSIDETDINDVDNKIHMINSTNNEKIFFADKVVLVEGPTDRIIFQSLINNILAQRDELVSIEVLDVGGKGLFDDYSGLLDAMSVPYFIIGDRDYAYTLSKTEEKENIKNLFEPNYDSIDDRMKKEGGGDVINLAETLEKALQECSKNKLVTVREEWKGIKANKRAFSSDLSEDESDQWNNYLKDKRKEQVYILSKGAIETYTPYAGKDINKAISLTEPDQLSKWTAGSLACDPPIELLCIAFEIINR